MEIDEHPTNRPDAEILTELTDRVQAELSLLAEHLRIWLEAHRTHPRELSVSSDPEGTRTVRVWLVTDHTGDSDASSRIVYDAARKMFGLVSRTDLSSKPSRVFSSRTRRFSSRRLVAHSASQTP